MNEEVENLIDKIITLNTWLRLAHPTIFKEPISFEVFNKWWWSPFYMLDEQTLGDISIRFGYAFYLLHEILHDYNHHEFLFSDKRFIVEFGRKNNLRTIIVKRAVYSEELLCVDIDIFIDYLGYTPIEKWYTEYDKLKKMALQNKK